MTRSCKIEGCEREHRAKGLCARHYNAALYRRQHPQPAADEVVVERLVAGERVSFNGLERRIAVRRLAQRGVPKTRIAQMLGVDGRQVYRDLARTG